MIKTPMLKPVLLIDGDMFLYKACAGVEREVRWDDQNHVLYSNADEAYEVFRSLIDNLSQHFSTNVLHLAFSGSNNFRKALSPDYKKHRTRKPLCYSQLLEYIFRDYSARKVDTLEGDDLLGIWATNGKFSNAIIVSEDKDMQTIPGQLYRKGELTTISVEQADCFWMTQTLTGDETDGYRGLPGCGPVKASKALYTEGASRDDGRTYAEKLWPSVVQAYEAAGLTEEDALLQARLARILRASDWDSEKKEVKLWNPS